jgi:hypothetical protein
VRAIADVTHERVSVDRTLPKAETSALGVLLEALAADVLPEPLRAPVARLRDAACAAPSGAVRAVGNSSAATVPLALDEAVREGRIEKGKLVVLVAFGAGLTWGGTLLRW